MNSINEWHKQDEPEPKPEKQPKPKKTYSTEGVEAWKKELQKFLDWHPLPTKGFDFYNAVAMFEKHLVEFAYSKLKLNKQDAAEYLRLGRTTFQWKFKLYGLKDNRDKKPKK